ncbi:MAG: alanine racemase, partial [Flavobacteriales bacterium]
KVVLRLQEQSHSTILEVNIDHLIHNINYYKRKIGTKAKMMAMVKAFGYGAGSAQLANTLAYHQIDYLGVAYADEGVALRNQGITLPIMVMNVPKDASRICLEYDLQPVVHSLKQLDSLLDEWKKLKAQKTPAVHLELETGMRRLGFYKKDLNQLLSRWNGEGKNLQVESIFSHFAGAGNPEHDDFTREQISLFTEMCEELKSLPGKKIKHLCNTSGIERWPEATFDMVRLGIGMYGISSSQSPEIKPVATLKTRISQIHIIEKGDSVGYNRAFVAKKTSSIATISIGYADGLNRALSNGKGQVLINGQLAPIVGNVCMDMTMIDISGISAAVGDQVTIFGKNPRIETMAKSLDTIGYEILSGISQRVKRIYIHD